MAKTNDKTEKVPKIALTAEELKAIEQLQAEEESNAAKAPERHEETLRNNKDVADLQDSVKKAAKLERGSPEYMALARQKRTE